MSRAGSESGTIATARRSLSASAAAATTAPAGPAAQAAAAVLRRQSANPSCNAPRKIGRDPRRGFVDHHAAVQEQQEFGRRAIGGVGGKQPVEPPGLGAYF